MFSAVARQMRSTATHSMKPRSFSSPAAEKSAGLSEVTLFPVGSQGFKAAWLSDPACYPIMFTIGFSLLFSGGFLLRELATNKDVRISKLKRKSTMRTWGEE